MEMWFNKTFTSICFSKNIIQTSGKCPLRGISSWRKLKKLTKSSRHKVDGVEKDNRVIFENGNRRYFVAAYLTCGFTVVPSILYASHVLYMDNKHKDLYFYSVNVGTDNEHKILAVLGLLLNLGFLWLVIKTMNLAMFRIYLNESSGIYTGICRGTLLKIQRIQFSTKDIIMKEPHPLLGNSLGNMIIHKKPYSLAFNDFISVSAYNKMLKEALARKP